MRYHHRMLRHILQKLLRWKDSELRKPLILRGARQVGKTYLLQHFAKAHYQDWIYVNFDEKPLYASLFEADLDPERILNELSLQFKKPIIPGETLIIFDEIQECPNALNSLKYFCEKKNEYHIAAAGSLLGVKMNQGFPVGKVNFIDLKPLSFFEFLNALGESALCEMLLGIEKPEAISVIFHEKLLQLLRYYFVVGGMPEVVSTFAKQRELGFVREIQQAILDAYALDFAKHAPREELHRIMAVWGLLPNQLARENKKFIFSAISKSARARNYEAAIQWLVDAGVIIKTYNLSKPNLPLMAYASRNAFKVFALDVGLLGAMSELTPETILQKDRLFTEFHGALTENYVAQELKNKLASELYYWTSTGLAEVDFVIADQQTIYPLEVKAGVSKQKKSLLVYGEKYHDTAYASPVLSRTTLRNFCLNGKILNYPLYAVALFPSLAD
jgi:uncharacterized protein